MMNKGGNATRKNLGEQSQSARAAGLEEEEEEELLHFHKKKQKKHIEI